MSGTKTTPRPKGHPASRLIVPTFSPNVTACIASIQSKIPMWHFFHESWWTLHALSGETIHPVLWDLAGNMIGFALHAKGERKMHWRDSYPAHPDDIKKTAKFFASLKAKSAGNHSLRRPLVAQIHKKDHERLLANSRLYLLNDIGALWGCAAESGDATFFEQWGKACAAIRDHGFGAHLPVRRSTKEMASPLTYEICTAILNLVFDGAEPTDAELGRFIFDWRKSECTLGSETAKTIASTVHKTRQRMGIAKFSPVEWPRRQ